MSGTTRKTLCAMAVCGMLTGWATAAQAKQPAKYLGPLDVVASADGKSLLVLNADARQIAVVDPGGKPIRSIDMPATPTGLVLSPDGLKLYVTCAAPEGTVCVLELASGELAKTIPVGHWACGPSISPDGKRLYVCNRFAGDVSFVDLAAGRELARVAARREPITSAVTPDGKLLLVGNHLPADRADQYGLRAVAAVVTLIDTQSRSRGEIRLTTGSSGVRGVCVSPDGKYGYVVHILSRYHLPTKQLEKGWMNTNALSILDLAAGKLVNTVLLDEFGRGAANPWQVASTADGKSICISHAGSHELTVIDAVGFHRKLAAIPAGAGCNAFIFGEPYYDYEYGAYPPTTSADVPNDLTFLDALRRRIRLPGNGPRGLAIAGSKVYVTEYFTDTLAVVDLAPGSAKPVTSFPLGPRPALSTRRKGQMWFSDASLCYEQWQSCSSCHPEGRVDGLNWDLLNDGTDNPKNVRSLLAAHKTPPAMCSGVRADAECAVRSGIAHIQFAVRPEEDAAAIDEYLKSLLPVPSPHLVGGQLSEAAKRGKKLFFSEKINCAKCHPEPLYTDLLMHDVGSRGRFDRRHDFDTPTLVEVWRTAPYMHDGRYTTIKELLVQGRHGNGNGQFDKLTSEQIDGLVEFVLSL